MGPFLSAADCNEQTIQSTVNIDPLPIQPYFDVGTSQIMRYVLSVKVDIFCEGLKKLAPSLSRFVCDLLV